MKRKLTWLVGWFCTALALGFVLWLRADGERKGGVASEGDEPRVTKPYPRERDMRERRTKNPREEFEAARKRGMTEEEVRWVVEDFLELGIFTVNQKDSSPEALLSRRQKEQKWYFDILVEGFQLTADQKMAAASKLRESLARDNEAYIESKKNNITYTIYSSYDGSLYSPEYGYLKISGARMFGIALWLNPMGLAPWSLFELDAEQKEMVGLKMEGDHWITPQSGSETVDFGTEEKYVSLDDPFSEDGNVISSSGIILPLSMEQVDRIRVARNTFRVSNNLGVRKPELLDEVKYLTISQLMTLLLFKPDMAAELMKDLGE